MFIKQISDKSFLQTSSVVFLDGRRQAVAGGREEE